jgi:hypothetical protein
VARTLPQCRILEAIGERGYALPCPHHHSSIITFLDLWELPDHRLSSTLSTKLEQNFYSRCPPENRPRNGPKSSPCPPSKDEGLRKCTTPSNSPPVAENEKKQDGTTKVSQTTKSFLRDGMKASDLDDDDESKNKYDSSLLRALHKTFFVPWWTAGILVFISGALLPRHVKTFPFSLTRQHRYPPNHNPTHQQSSSHVARRCVSLLPPHKRAEGGWHHHATSGNWVRYWISVCPVCYAR